MKLIANICALCHESEELGRIVLGMGTGKSHPQFWRNIRDCLNEVGKVISRSTPKLEHVGETIVGGSIAKVALLGQPLRCRSGSLGVLTSIVIGIHVLAQQHNFLHSLAFIQVTCFGNDGIQLPAALTAPREGHDAVGAHVVTAAHDGNKGRYIAGIGSDGCNIGIGLVET